MKLEIGRRLKRLRLEQGLTQKELAAKVSGGLDYTYIGKIERGEQLPSLKILIRISEALAVHVGDFFHNEAWPAVNGLAAPAEPGRLVRREKEREFFRMLNLLHADDIPLVVEIIRVLIKHRSAARMMPSGDADERTLLAAEAGAHYEKK